MDIMNESAPHNLLAMGRIIDTTKDEQGLVCQVSIKTKTHELEKPITKICLLQESECNSGKDCSLTMCQVVVTSDTRRNKTETVKGYAVKMML